MYLDTYMLARQCCLITTGLRECRFLVHSRFGPYLCFPTHYRRDNRLRITQVRRSSISRVFPAKTRSAFSSLGELAERCSLAAKICLASAIGFTVDSGWGQNLNKISPRKTIVLREDDDSDDDEEDEEEESDESILEEEESEACMQKCDSLLKDLESRLRGTRSQRLTVSVSFTVYQWKELAEATVTLRFRRRTSVDGNTRGWSSRGITCIAAIATLLPRSRCHEEGTAVMNLKNHGRDIGKEFLPDEESDEEHGGDFDHAPESDESEDDEEEFVPVAQDILDLLQEADEEAQPSYHSESDSE